MEEKEVKCPEEAYFGSGKALNDGIIDPYMRAISHSAIDKKRLKSGCACILF